MRRILVSVLAVLFFTVNPLQAQEFIEAAASGDLVKVKELLADNPALLHQTNEAGKSAVHYAAQNNELELLRYLHEQGADIDAPNVVDQRPLLYAVYFGNEEAVRYLLDQGVRVDVTDGYGDTVLDMAVMEGYEDIAALLREHGAVESVIGEAEVVQLAPQIRRIAFPYSQNPNSCLQVGADGILLVDTGWKRTAWILAAEVRSLAGSDADLIINTHAHPDHAGGNEILARKGVPIIGLATLDEAVAAGLVEEGEGVLPGEAGATFATWYHMCYNDETIHLIPYPDIHTENDMLVHFVGAKVVHMGDLLIGQSFPSVWQEPDRYLEFLQIVEVFFAPDVTLICGHGREMVPAQVGQYRRMLVEVRELVIKKLEAGQDIESIKACSDLERYEDYGVFIPQLSSDYWIDAIGRVYGG